DRLRPLGEAEPLRLAAASTRGGGLLRLIRRRIRSLLGLVRAARRRGLRDVRAVRALLRARPGVSAAERRGRSDGADQQCGCARRLRRHVRRRLVDGGLDRRCVPVHGRLAAPCGGGDVARPRPAPRRRRLGRDRPRLARARPPAGRRRTARSRERGTRPYESPGSSLLAGALVARAPWERDDEPTPTTRASISPPSGEYLTAL